MQYINFLIYLHNSLCDIYTIMISNLLLKNMDVLIYLSQF